MKHLFVGSHPNVVKFSDLDGRDRVCEIRAMITDAYRMLRDSIGEQAKNETNIFHGPWLVFRNLMNEHPAACLEEFRRASIYFDADTEGKVTEIADLIEQHIELTRQTLKSNARPTYQTDALMGISNILPDTQATTYMTQIKGRGHDQQHGALADTFKRYLSTISQKSGGHKRSTLELCVAVVSDMTGATNVRFIGNTAQEMHSITGSVVAQSPLPVGEIADRIDTILARLNLISLNDFVCGWE